MARGWACDRTSARGRGMSETLDSGSMGSYKTVTADEKGMVYTKISVEARCGPETRQLEQWEKVVSEKARDTHQTDVEILHRMLA